MPSNQEQVKLIFTTEFTERDAMEARQRGYRSHVLAEIGNRLYPLFFYDPERLRQDLADNTKSAQPYVAYPGMVILSEVTLQAMSEAIQGLYRQGYFDYLVPITKEQLRAANPYHWPP